MKGAPVKYKPTGELATIAQVHLEDATPYYTIAFGSGREKQTISEKLDVLTEAFIRLSMELSSLSLSLDSIGRKRGRISAPF